MHVLDERTTSLDGRRDEEVVELLRVLVVDVRVALDLACRCKYDKSRSDEGRGPTGGTPATSSRSYTTPENPANTERVIMYSFISPPTSTLASGSFANRLFKKS